MLTAFSLQVVVRQTKSGKEMKHDLMVMENLTFGRNCTRLYDLKGALHDRFNSAPDGPGDVLLDQNFVNDMNSSPFYVSNKAKQKLQRALWNDTSFLNVSLQFLHYYASSQYIPIFVRCISIEFVIGHMKFID
jgi:hypothetical protein